MKLLVYFNSLVLMQHLVNVVYNKDYSYFYNVYLLKIMILNVIEFF